MITIKIITRKDGVNLTTHLFEAHHPEYQQIFFDNFEGYCTVCEEVSKRYDVGCRVFAHIKKDTKGGCVLAINYYKTPELSEGSREVIFTQGMVYIMSDGKTVDKIYCD